MGPIGVKKHLAPFLPSHPVVGILNCLSCHCQSKKVSFRFEDYSFSQPPTFTCNK
jgi:glycine cleavage system protein P-like pyridoxal-binding family